MVRGNGAGQVNQIYTSDPSGTGNPGGTTAIRRHVQ